MHAIKMEIIPTILNTDALHCNKEKKHPSLPQQTALMIRSPCEIKDSMQLRAELLQHWSSRLSKPKRLFTQNIFP